MSDEKTLDNQAAPQTPAEHSPTDAPASTDAPAGAVHEPAVSAPVIAAAEDAPAAQVADHHAETAEPAPAGQEAHGIQPPAEAGHEVLEAHGHTESHAHPAPAAETAEHLEAPPEAAPADEAPRTESKPAKAPRKRSRGTKVAAEAAPAAVEPEPAAGNVAEADAGEAAGDAPAAPEADSKKKWYVVKVQSGREDSIKAAIERKVKIEGLEEYFGQIAIPVEELIQKKTVKVTDKKTGDKVTQEKKVIKYQKKFPGYIFAEVEFNDRILYLFRETSGVGDFVGASLKRDPTPMTEREVRTMLTGVVEPGQPGSGAARVKLDYEKGDKVKIRDGAFANMEGIVKSITDSKETGETPKIKVEVTIFGRPVEVDLDYWHVDKA
jgi:transcriptional antiterminator NusG